MNNSQPAHIHDQEQIVETAISIKGMTCASCVRRVENALVKKGGVESAVVNFATHHATVRHDIALEKRSCWTRWRGPGTRQSSSRMILTRDIPRPNTQNIYESSQRENLRRCGPTCGFPAYSRFHSSSFLCSGIPEQSGQTGAFCFWGRPPSSGAVVSFTLWQLRPFAMEIRPWTH